MVPTEVEALLAWYEPRLQAALGAMHRSTLLYGSAAAGDFAPGWSDVDLCVVVGAPLGRTQRDALERLSAETAERYVVARAGGWRSGQAMDVAVVTPEALADPASAALKPFDRLSLSAHARHRAGERLEVPPPTREALQRQLARELLELDAALESRSPIWMADRMAWAARSLAYWCDGELLGKGPALERAARRRSEHRAAFAEALAVRRSGSPSAVDREEALRGALDALRGPLRQTLVEASGLERMRYSSE